MQRRHNLYRDSIVLTNSDPNLHLLGETPQVDWATKFGADEPDSSLSSTVEGRGTGRRRKQVVSMIQLDGLPLPYESCLEVPGVELIPEEDGEVSECKEDEREDEVEDPGPSDDPKSPDSVDEIRNLINPVVEMVVQASEEELSDVTSKSEPTSGLITMEDGVQEEVTHVTSIAEDVPSKSPQDKTSPQSILQELIGSKKQEADKEHQEEEVIQKAVEEMKIAVQAEDGERIAEASTEELHSESPPLAADSSSQHDSGFQSPSSEALDEGEPQPITNGLSSEDKIISPAEVEVILT